MRKLPCFLLVLLLVASCAHAADLIDRIVATVNGHVILQSDWDDAVRFEAFIEGRPLGLLTDPDRGKALDRLIDQELLREQAQSAEVPPPAEEIKQRVLELQAQHACTTPSAWQAVLAGYGLDENQLESRLAHEMSTLRQVEARLRPTVQIDSQSIESYYRDQFLPKLRKSGAQQDVPLASVTAKIREILTEEKVNQIFSSWLQSLRAESKIHTSVATSSPPPPVGGQE
jgi:peptidyl-prolyl cis-trans isomerase SurA